MPYRFWDKVQLYTPYNMEVEGHNNWTYGRSALIEGFQGGKPHSLMPEDILEEFNRMSEVMDRWDTSFLTPGIKKLVDDSIVDEVFGE